MLISKNSKIDLLEEKRQLENWIQDYERNKELLENEKMYEECSYEKLKDIAKQMYFSPIEYGDLYYNLKGKLESADSIKKNLKTII